MELVLESYRKDVLNNTGPRKVFERILFGRAVCLRQYFARIIAYQTIFMYVYVDGCYLDSVGFMVVK